MEVTFEDRPYEFLARFSDQGEYQGAHVIYAKYLVQDGVGRFYELGPAIDLGNVEDPAFVAVAGLVSIAQQRRVAQLEAESIAISSAHLESVQQLHQQYTDQIALQAEGERLQREILEQSIARLQSENVLLRSECDRLTAQNSGLMAQAEEMRSEVARLQAEIDQAIAHEQEL